MTEVYEFWGIVQSQGRVKPANKDYTIFYTEQSVQNNLEGLVGTPIIIMHQRDETGGVDPYEIGQVVDYELLEDNLFVLNRITQEKFEQFKDNLEKENKFIRLSYNQLTEEIDAGNLALSAGLENVATTSTQVHQRTVAQYDWKEVSIVPNPASPGAWAFGCDDQCQIVFSDTMSEQEPELEPSDGGDDPEEVEQEGEVHNEPQIPETVQMGDEEYQLVPVEEVEQTDCNCETEKLERKIEQLQDENEKLNTLVEEFKQQRREEAKEDIKQINQALPEERAYSEDELEQMFENDSASELRQTADLMERLAPERQEISQSEEDLSGSSNGSEVDEEKERINQVSKELFGKDFETKMQEIEQEYGGEA